MQGVGGLAVKSHFPNFILTFPRIEATLGFPLKGHFGSWKGQKRRPPPSGKRVAFMATPSNRQKDQDTFGKKRKTPIFSTQKLKPNFFHLSETKIGFPLAFKFFLFLTWDWNFGFAASKPKFFSPVKEKNLGFCLPKCQSWPPFRRKKFGTEKNPIFLRKKKFFQKILHPKTCFSCHFQLTQTFWES